MHGSRNETDANVPNVNDSGQMGFNINDFLFNSIYTQSRPCYTTIFPSSFFESVTLISVRIPKRNGEVNVQKTGPSALFSDAVIKI